MQIAQVVGTLVSTQKHDTFKGAKLLLVQPLAIDGTPRGDVLLAADGVGAGVHEKVLVVLEGRAAGEVLGRNAAPVDAAIVGIIDHVECQEQHPAPGRIRRAAKQPVVKVRRGTLRQAQDERQQGGHPRSSFDKLRMSGIG
jgi:microcompartment protein CcmK/EutM